MQVLLPEKMAKVESKGWPVLSRTRKLWTGVEFLQQLLFKDLPSRKLYLRTMHS